MEYTLVFDYQTARALIKKGYKIIDMKPNKNNPLYLVFFFEGDIGEEKEKILKALGKK